MIFDGILDGVNTTGVITLSPDKTSLIFPANKAFKITGMIGIRGTDPSSSNTAPAYITSKFEVDDPTKARKLISTQGYTESSTEAFDDGGVSNPIIIFTTGTTGGSVYLNARYSGSSAPANNYYLAGAPTATSLGTYFIIEEL